MAIAITGINESTPYGPDSLVKKLKFIKHMSKRLYSRLVRIKSGNKVKTLSDGKEIDGKGRLSIDLMKELQTVLREGDTR